MPALAILVACGHPAQDGRAGGPGSPPDQRATDTVAGGEVAGMCAMSLQFRGTEYQGVSVAIAPEVGGELGEGVFPPCNDTGGSPGPPQHVPLEALPDVSPEDAVLVRGWDDVVMIRQGLDPLPPEIERLVAAPSCAPEEPSLQLEGRWLGIVGADGKTELDLLPPYDVDLRVRSASSDRYTGAQLTLRVPATLGTPISHDDVRRALWHPGSLTAQVHCGDDGQFIVDEISVAPDD